MLKIPNILIVHLKDFMKFYFLGVMDRVWKGPEVSGRALRIEFENALYPTFFELKLNLLVASCQWSVVKKTSAVYALI